MSKHYIKNIEIKNFKCFEDFKAEGFGRVNLIGGKNNVGKTAFMEAVYISNSKKNLNHIIRIRYISDILEDLWQEIGKKFSQNFITTKVKEHQNYQITSNIENLKVKIIFKSSNKARKADYDIYYSEIIKNELEDTLDNYLKEFDNSIEKFRIIKSQPHCQKNGKFYNINEFGDGLGKFISLILLVLSSQDTILLIDEIDNGIHYTNLDKLWEIILTISNSKQQNVQVFATTHSKDCIESYARVAKKLEDEDVTYSILSKLKSGQIHHSLYDKTLLETAFYQKHEVR
jgi:AAA15 family ATPase/GTPase